MILRSLLFLVAALVTSPALAAGPVTPEMFGSLPTVDEAAISPDGSTIAALHNFGGNGIVLFYDLANPGAKPVGVNAGSVNARDIQWADNGHLLLLLSASKDKATSRGFKVLEFFRWMSISKSTQKAVTLFTNEGGYYMSEAGTLLSVLPNEPGSALFARSSASRTGQLGYSLLSINLDNGRSRQVEAGGLDTEGWVVTATGEPLVRVDYNDDKEQREIRLKKEGSSKFDVAYSFKELRSSDAIFELHGQSSTPRKISATMAGSSDKRSLVELDLDSGQFGSPLFTNPDYDVDEVVFDPHTATATAVRYTDNLPRTFHLNSSLRALQANLESALPGAAPKITSQSADGGRMIVRITYTDHPDQIFLFDKKTRKLSLLSATYQALDGKVFARKEKYDYRTTDNFDVRGYLTVPKGASKSNMPLIVLPHGGPWARDDQAFDWWPFFYASRGYLVYQPNFRGSDGYGAAFKAAGYGEWGRKMQDDITEGVRHLINDGVVDPTRICIVGASYGGYAALAGATLTPDLYKCAISVNGISDLITLLGQRTGSDSAREYWDVRIGNLYRDEKALEQVSPARNAEKATAPIMLIHARDDIVVPFGQGAGMRDALVSAGKSVEFVELKGEDHWLSSSETRTQMLSKSIEFIDKHIGASPPPN